MYRCKHFSASFEEALLRKQPDDAATAAELGAYDYATQSESLRKLLKRIKHAMSASLECTLDRSSANDVTVPCLDLLCRDVGQLFKIYEDLLLELMSILRRDQHVPYSLTPPNNHHKPIGISSHSGETLSADASDGLKVTEATPQILEADSIPITPEIRQHIGFCEYYLQIQREIEQWTDDQSRILHSYDYPMVEVVKSPDLAEKVAKHLKDIGAFNDAAPL
jgi:hypothetical protein